MTSHLCNIQPFLRIWAEVNRRMRKTERSWPKNKRETRAEYKHRLKLTALAIPRSYIRKAVEDMKRRCEAVVEAEGWYFKE